MRRSVRGTAAPGTLGGPLPQGLSLPGAVGQHARDYLCAGAEADMDTHDSRPSLGIAHVVMETDRMAESAEFFRKLGMRPVFLGLEVSVLELRGGTHLILQRRDTVRGGAASFDLMVDDLRDAHRRFTALGLAPSAIEARPAIDHELFTIREPAGHAITVFSNHVSGKPV